MRSLNKKINILIIIVIFSLIVFINLFLRATRFNNLVISQKKFDEIIKTREKDDNLKILNLKFDSYELIFDEQTDIYYYSIVEDSLTAYNPFINYSFENNNIKLTILEYSFSKEDILNNKSIKILIYNDKSYKIFNVVCTTLPLININFNGEINGEDTIMDFYLFDNRKNATQRIKESKGYIHLRGATSLAFPKKGYRISLKNETTKGYENNKISLLDMREDDDWILYAAYSDQEKIRNVFSTNLWYESSSKNNSINAKNGIEYRYVELF